MRQLAYLVKTKLTKRIRVP